MTAAEAINICKEAQEKVERADLRCADLRGADLRGAELRDADLSGADLRYSSLRGAYLRGAYLRGAYLRGADLIGAYLRDADMSGAELRDADLSGADLRYSSLRDADLSGAELRGAYLRDADLRDAKNIQSIIAACLLMCPQIGSFIAFKKCKTLSGKDSIVKLLIPEDAKRSSATTRKCRASHAIVLEIDGSKSKKKTAYSYTHGNTKYKVGETVYADSFDENRWIECSNGIHFFMTREEAEAYN